MALSAGRSPCNRPDSSWSHVDRMNRKGAILPNIALIGHPGSAASVRPLEGEPDRQLIVEGDLRLPAQLPPDRRPTQTKEPGEPPLPAGPASVLQREPIR